MSADHARALAMAYELQSLLHSLVERRGDARTVAALDLLENVLDELDTLGADDGERSTTHSLRLLVTDPGGQEARWEQAQRKGQAMRHLATKPWRRT